MTKHQKVSVPEAAADGLARPLAFTVPVETEGPTVLTRTADAEVFLVIRYSLS